MSLQEKIKTAAAKYSDEIIADRRHIHANPELSFKEFNTYKYVSEKLQSFGLSPKQVTETGIGVLIEGKNPGRRTVALRADMDALPIFEANDVPYKSKNEGVMHACGHDVHTASLLGTARILNDLRNEFEGTVKLIFQPGEEKLPGGASLMIKEGILENPKPQSVVGQHVLPHLPVGKFGFRSGMYMASADEIYVTVRGKGGHGAMPENGIDPVLITAHMITALQQIISRNAGPKRPSVLTFGRIIADGATNVIPNEVIIHGTFRCMDEEWRYDAHRRMKKMAESLAEGMGGSCDFNIMTGYPFLKNEPLLTERLRTAAESYVGPENVVELDLWLAGEDFAYYTQHADACFYRLGVGNPEKGITSGVHTPTFNIDEKALELGAGMMSWLTVNELMAG